MRLPISDFQSPFSRGVGKLGQFCFGGWIAFFRKVLECASPLALLKNIITPRKRQRAGALQDADACLSIRHSQLALRNSAAFTLIEIAICLAIIGFALVAIIGVLPLGMNAQRANREETVINQDATVLINAIRDGAQGLDYLTNYVYAITNTVTTYAPNGAVLGKTTLGYTYNSADNGFILTNGYRIVGLLSTPLYSSYNPRGFPISDTFKTSYYSNHVVAYVHSISGLAAEKPPQDNQIMRDDTFGYRLYCVNAPMPVNTNTFNSDPFAKQLAASQRELRLTFLWPQLPNGKLGFGRQTYRATIAGQLTLTNDLSVPLGQWLYFYQPQIFTNSIP